MSEASENSTNWTSVVVECEKQQTKSVTVGQESYARKISIITMSAHRHKHMSETLSADEHTTLMAKRGELNWLATQSMIQLLAPSSLIDTSKNSHRTKSQGIESIRATGAL